MEEIVPFGSSVYIGLFTALALGRAADFISTWVATPNLALEANPIAKKLGWRAGIVLNIVVCILFAAWPLPAIVVATSSALVAARNFQSAWLMRSMGEFAYRAWMRDRMMEGSFKLYAACLIAQSALVAVIGCALMWFSDNRLIPFAIGLGVVAYSLAVFVFTFLAVYRLRRNP